MTKIRATSSHKTSFPANENDTCAGKVLFHWRGCLLYTKEKLKPNKKPND